MTSFGGKEGGGGVSQDWPSLANSEQPGEASCWSSDHIDYLDSKQWMEQTADGSCEGSLETTMAAVPEQTALLRFYLVSFF